MTKRKTFKEIKESIEEQGFLLLTETYKNNSQKLSLMCSQGHRFTRSWREFLQGRTCPKCMGYNRYSLNDVKEYINRFNYVLLSNTYKNVDKKLAMKCPRGHEYLASFYSFKQGNRCPYCSHQKGINYEYINNYFKSINYKLLSTNYKNAKQKLDVKCDRGHEFETSWDVIHSGKRCPFCYQEDKKLNYYHVKEKVENFGYKLKSKTYNGENEKLLIECPNGHLFKMEWRNFNTRHNCPKCGSSRGENLIRGILTNILPNEIKFIEQYSVTIKGHRRIYDFYIPSIKLFIEYDGKQHFEKVNKGWEQSQSLEERQKIDQEKNNWAINHKMSIARFPYNYSDEEIHKQLQRLLMNHGLVIKNIKLNYNKLKSLGKSRMTTIGNYYLTHSVKETSEKFNVSYSAVVADFKYTYGSAKRKYLEGGNNKK